MSRKPEPDKPRVKRKRYTPRQLITKAVAAIPNAKGFELVKRDGRVEVYVQVEESLTTPANTP